MEHDSVQNDKYQYDSNGLHSKIATSSIVHLKVIVFAKSQSGVFVYVTFMLFCITTDGTGLCIEWQIPLCIEWQIPLVSSSLVTIHSVIV